MLGNFRFNNLIGNYEFVYKSFDNKGCIRVLQVIYKPYRRKLVYKSVEESDIIPKILSIDIDSKSHENQIIDFLEKYGLMFNLSIFKDWKFIDGDALFIEKEIILEFFERMQNLIKIVNSNYQRDTDNILRIIRQISTHQELIPFYDSKQKLYGIKDKKIFFDEFHNEDERQGFSQDIWELINPKTDITKINFSNIDIVLFYTMTELIISYIMNQNSMRPECHFRINPQGQIDINIDLKEISNVIYIELIRITENNLILKRCLNPSCKNQTYFYTHRLDKLYCCNNCGKYVSNKRNSERKKIKERKIK